MLTRTGLAAALLVLTVRLWVLLQLTDTAFFAQDHGDSGYYLRWAGRIASGVWSDGQAFLGLPLYPYLLAIFQLLHLPNPWAPLLLQAFSDAATGAVICLAVCRTASRPEATSTTVAGLVTALAWALYVPAQSFAATLMPNTLGTLVFAATLLGLMRWGVGGLAWRGTAWLGFGLGFAAMLSANLLFLLPLVALAAWPSTPTMRGGMLRFLPRLALLALCVVAGASPSWLHNYAVAREPVALSAHSGINFYIGNNPLATGYPNFPPGIRASQEGLLEDSARLAEAALGRPLRRFEVSAYWSERASKFIAEDRAAWMRLISAKLRNYYSAYEYDDISTIRPLRILGVTLPGPSFAWVAIAAAMGLVGGFLQQPATRWAAAAVVLHTLSVLPAFVTERYRLMAVPALLMLAGCGLLTVWENLRLGRMRWQWAACVLAGGLMAWVAYSAPRPGGVEVLADYNTAVRLLAAGNREQAVPLIERVEQSGAANAEVALLLGNFWFEAGEAQRALRHYREAIRREPTLLRAWNNAAVLTLREKSWDEAAGYIGYLRHHAPQDSRVHYYAAQLALAKGDAPAAALAIQEALRLRPGEAAYVELARTIENAPSLGRPTPDK